MNVETVVGVPVDTKLLRNYFDSLVDRFFKIIPIRESEEETLPVYMQSLQMELLGCREFIPELCVDDEYMTLLAILQYLVDHPECKFASVRREAFRAIRICKRLKYLYEKRGC
jgi:hypothetical protein